MAEHRWTSIAEHSQVYNHSLSRTQAQAVDLQQQVDYFVEVVINQYMEHTTVGCLSLAGYDSTSAAYQNTHTSSRLGMFKFGQPAARGASSSGVWPGKRKKWVSSGLA